jgi:hypothetical protein
MFNCGENENRTCFHKGSAPTRSALATKGFLSYVCFIDPRHS